MPALLDPLRNTLDHLALDPKAREDRRYLVSMLRRLGYSDKEIEAVLGWEGDGPRVIEVEYEPPGTRPGPGGFTVIDGWEPENRATPATSVGFSVARDAGDAARAHGWLAADDPAVAHGWVPDTVEFRERDAGEADASQAWPAWPDQEAEAAPADDAWEEVPAQEWQDQTPSDAWPEAPAENEWQEAPGETEWQEAPTDTEWPEAPAETAWEESPAQTQEAPAEANEHEALAETAWPEAEPAWEDATADDATAGQWQVVEDDEPWSDADSSDAGTQKDPWAQDESDGQTWSNDESWDSSWDDASEGAQESWDVAQVDEPAVSDDYAIKDAPAGAWQPAADEAEAPFTYEGYTLHTRMVELSTGQEQRIFFFAKNAPKSGQPCPLPPGYIVETNDRTGLPFLRRDPDAETVDLAQWGGAPDVADAPTEEPETVQEFCLAITKAGNQCRRGPRDGSKYCATHKGWRGPRAN